MKNNKNINDINEGLVTSMFYYDPNCSCYKNENDIDSNNNNMIKYVLNKVIYILNIFKFYFLLKNFINPSISFTI